MALEQIKTQVLLLHSQQSTLDTLSAGFGDRYAVHVATSGSEALTTLGETPIHVIVSAQDLPGMSGLEALREAKKRSPDTVGILLAGEDGDDGLEALVGDKEVFQIVRGAVTSEALLELVENATRQVRLLAISESANDLAANVDEPAGEHIVMETSDNGASIISDGTARLRAIRSRQPRIASSPGGGEVDVLVLTKDEEFLATIMESSQELHNVHHANTPTQAESIVRNHKVGVLVTDAAMAASEIEAITERLRKDVARLVAIVAGRRDDGELLMDLINRGQVYRFLLKPVSPGRARLAIEASVKHHLEGPEKAFGNKSRPAPATPKPSRAPTLVPASKGPAGKQARQGAKPEPAARAEPEIGPVEEESGAATSARAEPPLTAQQADGAEDGISESGRFRRTVTNLSETLGGVPADGDGRSFLKPALLGGGGIAVAVIAGLLWWLAPPDMLPGLREVEESIEPAGSSPERSPSVVESDLPLTEIRLPDRDGVSSAPAPVPAYQTFLDDARLAREAGEIVTPAGSNAIEMYLAALEIAPDDPFIVAELAEVVDEAVALAETALLEQRTADAVVALDLVRLATPENPRLPFLDAQVAQLQLRSRLDRARAAIREQRFEDAAAALTAAEDLVGTEHPDVASLHEELETARSAQRVDEVLGLANERLADGALTAPPNDNARYYFELALSNDPENAVARQGLTLVAGKLVLQARDAIDNGALDDAEAILADARALDPQSSEVTAAIDALTSEQAAVEAERQAEAERVAEAERQAELELQASLEQQAAALETAGEGEADDRSAEETSAAAEPRTDGGLEQSFAAPGMSASRQPDGAAAADTRAADGSSDQSGSSDPGAYVAISSLKRTNYVAPRYPRSAERRSITGWADVSFVVTTEGSVSNVEILDSSPGDIFDQAATEAIAQWRFEPSLVDGMPVERLVAVRLAFSLE